MTGTSPAAGDRRAVGHLAEDTFTALEPAARTVAQQVLLRLVVPGRAADGSDDGARTAGYGELTEGRPAPELDTVRQVLHAFTAAGLLERDPDGAVRPRDPDLARTWPRLRRWTAEHRAALRLARDTEEAARAWEREGRRPEALRAAATAYAAGNWTATAPPALWLAPPERAFAAACAADAARRAERRRRLRAGVALSVVAALLAGAVGWWQYRVHADRAVRAAAASAADAAADLRRVHPDTAALLSVAAWRVAHVDEARAALYTSLGTREHDAFEDPTPTVAEGADADLADRRLSGDGHVLLTTVRSPHRAPQGTATTDTTYRYDVRTAKRLTRFRAPKGARLRAVSADGRYAAYGDTVHDLTTGRPVGTVGKVPGRIEAVSGDGRRVAVRDGDTVTFADTRTGGRLLSADTLGGARTVLSPNGRWAAACPRGDGPVLYDLTGRTAKPLPTTPSLLICSARPKLAFSPDSGRLVLENHPHLLIWDTGSGKVRTTRSQHPQHSQDPQDPQDFQDSEAPQGGDGDGGEGTPSGDDDGSGGSADDTVSFSTDGKAVLLTSGRLATVLSATDLDTSLYTYRAPYAVGADSGGVPVAALDSTTHTLRHLSQKTVAAVDLAPALTARRHTATSTAAAFGPRARTLVTAQPPTGPDAAGEPEEHSEWDTESAPRPQVYRVVDPAHAGAQPRAERLREAAGKAPEPGALAVSPDGQHVAVGSETADGAAVALTDLRTGRHRTVSLHDRSGKVGALAYGPDGRTLAVSFGGYRDQEFTRLLDVSGHAKPRKVAADGGAVLALGGPGALGTLVTSSSRVVDVESGRVRSVRPGAGTVTGAAFSPDGKYLAVSSHSGVTLWKGDASERLATLTPPPGKSSPAVRSPRFSADGGMLAGLVGGSEFQLWDVASGQALGEAQSGAGDELNAIGFADHDVLRLSGRHVLAYAVDLDPDHVADTLCAGVSGAGPHNLTRAQWHRYLPDVPYRTVCD